MENKRVLNMENKNLTGILFFGSLWGMLEATLGALLHLMAPLSPYTGAIMLSVGVFIMSYALRAHKPGNTLMFTFCIGLTASLLKGFDIILLGPQPEVINPMAAIVIEALAFGAVVRVLQEKQAESAFKAPLTGLATGYASHLGFSLSFAYLLKSEFWASKGIYGILNFTATSGTLAGILCAIAVPLGYTVGDGLTPNLVQFRERRPVLSYALTCATIIGCWVVGVTYG
jgi:hypothetical protein